MKLIQCFSRNKMNESTFGSGTESFSFSGATKHITSTLQSKISSVLSSPACVSLRLLSKVAQIRRRGYMNVILAQISLRSTSSIEWEHHEVRNSRRKEKLDYFPPVQRSDADIRYKYQRGNRNHPLKQQICK